MLYIVFGFVEEYKEIVTLKKEGFCEFLREREAFETICIAWWNAAHGNGRKWKTRDKIVENVLCFKLVCRH